MRTCFVFLLAGALSVASAGISTGTALAAKGAPELDRTYLRLAGGTRSLHRMVECLVNQNEDLARGIFDLDTGSLEQSQAIDSFFDYAGGCLFAAASLRSDGVLAAGTIAERLIMRDKPSLPQAPARLGPFSGGGVYTWTWRALVPRASQESVPVAFCLVDRHGQKVAEVLVADPTSNEERKLFNAMHAQIASCIPAEESYTLQPQIFRAALAFAYYSRVRQAARGE